jgi:hypothetical protein
VTAISNGIQFFVGPEIVQTKESEYFGSFSNFSIILHFDTISVGFGWECAGFGPKKDAKLISD